MIIKRVSDALSFDNFKRIGDWITKMAQNWALRGDTVTMTLAVGNNNLFHNLGRVVTKIFPVFQNGSAAFYFTPHSDPTHYIVVNSTAAFTVTFFVD